MSWADTPIATGANSIPDGAGDFSAAARRVLEYHWRKFAKLLPRQASVLEIGAGSCVVSKWILSARPDLKVVATDCGIYQPDLSGARKIDFQGGVMIEALPFEACSFDAVISQFAFEYADRHVGLSECHRVLRDTGRLSFVMHTDRGALYDGCRLRIAVASMLLDDPAIPVLLEKAAKIAGPLGRKRMVELNLQPQIADRFAKMRDLERSAGMLAAGMRSYLNWATQLADSPAFENWVNRSNRQFYSDLDIARAQFEAALSDADMDSLIDDAADIGFVSEKVKVVDFCNVWNAMRRAPSASTRSPLGQQPG